jgi:hypothetical protein
MLVPNGEISPNLATLTTTQIRLFRGFGQNHLTSLGCDPC